MPLPVNKVEHKVREIDFLALQKKKKKKGYKILGKNPTQHFFKIRNKKQQNIIESCTKYKVESND